MNINFRNMKPRDYSQLIKLWKETPGIGISSSDDKEKIKIFLKKNNRTCFVAEDEKEIIGTILCGNDGRRGYIYHLVVSENYRNKGIASRLVEYSLEGLKSDNIDKCHLFVYETNKNAIKYYLRKDWKQRKELIILSKDVLNLH
jgi:N-acetylglutamate synthase